MTGDNPIPRAVEILNNIMDAVYNPLTGETLTERYARQPRWYEPVSGDDIDEIVNWQIKNGKIR